MPKQLKNIKVAMVVCDGFEESEMVKPRQALQKAGVTVELIAPKKGKVTAWRNGKWTNKYEVDRTLKDARAKDYAALVLPGGVINPDKLRTEKRAIKFVKHFFQTKKPIAAICHGPLTLIETKKLKGRTMTSYSSIKTDLKNAGVKWQNKKVVNDRNLISSRSPKDIPAFNKAILKVLKKGE